MIAFSLASALLTACASGARAKAESPACDAGEVWDRAACVPEACGEGEYGGLAETPFTAGPNGAYASIQAALDAAASAGGGVVAVAAGTYTETLALGRDHAGVTLAGRCRALVTLDGSEGEKDAPLFYALGTSRTVVAVQDITLADARGVGVRAEGLDLTLQGVRVTGSGSVGIIAEGYGTRLTLQDVEVDSMAPGANREGVAAFDGTTVIASALRVHDVPNIAVDVLGNLAAMTLDGCEVHDIAEGPDKVGVAFRVADGGQLTAKNCDISATVGEALYVADDDSILEIRDSSIHDVLPGSNDFLPGWGAYVLRGGTLVSVGNVWERTAGGISVQSQAQGGSYGDSFLNNDVIGAFSTGAGARLDMQDCEIDGVRRFERANAYGYGVAAIQGGKTSITNCRISDAAGGGALAQGAGAVLNVESTELSFCGTAHADPPGYNGVAAADGADVLVEDSDIHDIVGTQVGATDASVTLRRVAIHDSDPSGGLSAGIGVHAWNLGVVTMEDVHLARMHSVAVAAQQDGAIHLDGVTIDDTAPDAGGSGGVGVFAGGGRIDGRDLTITGAHGMGGDAQAGGVIDLDGAVVSGTRASTYYAGGVGIAALGGRVALSNTTLTDNEGVGLWCTERGSLTCAGCIVTAARFAGAAVRGGTLSLSSTTVSGVVSDPSFGGGVGLYGNVEDGFGHLDAADVTVDAAPYAGAWFEGAGEWSLTDSSLAGGSGVALREGLIMHGNAVFAADGAIPSLRSDTLHDATIGVLLDDAAATLSDISWRANTLDFRAQSCPSEAAQSVPDDASAAVCPDDALLTLRFDYNLVPIDITGESE